MSGPDVVLWLGGAVVAGALLFFGQFAYWTLEARDASKQAALARRIGALPVETTSAAPLLRARTTAEGALARRFDALLRQAGSTASRAALLGRIAAFAGTGVLALLLALRSPLALVGAAAGALPVLHLARTAEARARLLGEQLPDGLDLVARSMQAGHAFSEALRTAAEEMPEPLAQELGRVAEEQNLGRDLRECMQNLLRRNPESFDLRIFVAAVLLQRDTGGNLVEVLQGLASTIRARALFQGRVRALSAEARFTAWVLGGLPFFVLGLIALLQPHYLDPLVHEPLGRALLLGCGLLFVAGTLTMRAIARVEA